MHRSTALGSQPASKLLPMPLRAPVPPVYQLGGGRAGSGALPAWTRANPHACHRHRQRALRTQARYSIVDRPDRHRPGLYSRRRVDEHQDGRKHNSSHPPEKTFSLHILQVRLAHGSLKETSPQAAQCGVFAPTDQQAGAFTAPWSGMGSMRSTVAHCGSESMRRHAQPSIGVPGPDLISLAPRHGAYADRSCRYPVLASLGRMRPDRAWKWSTVGRHGRPRAKPSQAPVEAAAPRRPGSRTLVPCLPSVSPAPEASFARTSTA